MSIRDTLKKIAAGVSIPPEPYVIIHWTTSGDFQEETFGPYTYGAACAALAEYQVSDIPGYFCLAPLYQPGREPFTDSDEGPIW